MKRSYSFLLSKQVALVSKLCVRLQWVVFSVRAMFLFSMPLTATDEHRANLPVDVREILVHGVAATHFTRRSCLSLFKATLRCREDSKKRARSGIYDSTALSGGGRTAHCRSCGSHRGCRPQEDVAEKLDSASGVADRGDDRVQRLVPVDSLYVRTADGFGGTERQLLYIFDASCAGTSPELGLWKEGLIVEGGRTRTRTVHFSGKMLLALRDNSTKEASWSRRCPIFLSRWSSLFKPSRLWRLLQVVSGTDKHNVELPSQFRELG